jgi:GcrA cell cycle regulator
MDWSPLALARLRALWAEGHATAEIARRLGCTKNAVIGKAHRLNLPARPSPIRRDRPPRSVRAPRAPAVTIPTLPSVSRPAQNPIAPAPSATARIAAARPPEPCAFVLRSAPRRGMLAVTCDAPVQQGAPYCAHHTRICYVRRRPHRLEGAAAHDQ